MKALFFSLLLLLISIASFSQLKPGMLLHGRFAGDDNQYVAEVVTATGSGFTCRFVHSNSVYTMQEGEGEMNNTMSAINRTANVVSSRGGKFKAGARFSFHAFAPQADECAYGTGAGYWDNLVIATFADGKKFLGEAKAGTDKCTITFLHSGAVYEFDKNGIVLTSTGGYKKEARQRSNVHRNKNNKI